MYVFRWYKYLTMENKKTTYFEHLVYIQYIQMVQIFDHGILNTLYNLVYIQCIQNEQIFDQGE